MTSTTAIAPSPASKLKDLVVTAAVASLVSAVVAPWIRRWMDGPTAMAYGHPPRPAPPKPSPPADDFDAHLERLLDVPDTFSDFSGGTALKPADQRKDRSDEAR